MATNASLGIFSFYRLLIVLLFSFSPLQFAFQWKNIVFCASSQFLVCRSIMKWLRANCNCSIVWFYGIGNQYRTTAQEKSTIPAIKQIQQPKKNSQPRQRVAQGEVSDSNKQKRITREKPRCYCYGRTNWKCITERTNICIVQRPFGFFLTFIQMFRVHVE